jgi:hypothetical protein
MASKSGVQVQQRVDAFEAIKKLEVLSPEFVLLRGGVIYGTENTGTVVLQKLEIVPREDMLGVSWSIHARRKAQQD